MSAAGVDALARDRAAIDCSRAGRCAHNGNRSPLVFGYAAAYHRGRKLRLDELHHELDEARTAVG